jgi:hypothetical protein
MSCRGVSRRLARMSRVLRRWYSTTHSERAKVMIQATELLGAMVFAVSDTATARLDTDPASDAAERLVLPVLCCLTRQPPDPVTCRSPRPQRRLHPSPQPS